jgi:hypothetical protein
MANKWDRVHSSFDRAHSDLFSLDTYAATFFNISQGTRDNLNDEYTGESRNSIGTIQVELVPPAIDSTVRTEGTSFSWDTSIRFPLDESVVGSLKPYGEDNEQPTEVEIIDDQDNDNETYQLQGYSIEKGSDMVMCRLVEK